MLKAHFISKKFGSFFIGSTFINKNKLIFTVYENDEKIYASNNKYLSNKLDLYKLNPYILKVEDIKQKIKVSTLNIYSIILANFALPINQLIFYIKLHNKNNVLHCEVPASRKPYLGCSIMATEKGMQIIMIKSESPAEKANLKIKDIIQEIDGQRISTINEYNAAVGQIANKKAFKILRTENGKELTLSIEVEYSYLD